MKTELKSFLKVNVHQDPVEYKVREEVQHDGFRRLLIEYRCREGDAIPAFLFIPVGKGPFPAVLVHHQHAGERHFGKSEVAGLKGDPLQAFGPALAKRGFVVLAPDSICFEDRRIGNSGSEPGEGESDWLQHFNELTYRLVRGDTLMRKILDDASIGFSLLFNSPLIDRKRVGVLGHSYGGNTTLFQAAIDERIAFSCSSGAACTYKNKMAVATPFEFALTIPGFCAQYDIEDLVKGTAPRDVLIVSGTDDKYSKDADEIYRLALPAFEGLNVRSKIQHKSYVGGHALTEERFEFIQNWIAGH